MKNINQSIWIFLFFHCMFSYFPFLRVVESRPSSSSASRAIMNSNGPITQLPSPIIPPPRVQTLQNFNVHNNNCPFLEGPSAWPSYLHANAETYRTDITLKFWESPLVLEGTARSRSEVREDGTYGVTFDLLRVVKGDAPVLRRRKQFRLQFQDDVNPTNNSLTSQQQQELIIIQNANSKPLYLNNNNNLLSSSSSSNSASLGINNHTNGQNPSLQPQHQPSKRRIKKSSSSSPQLRQTFVTVHHSSFKNSNNNNHLHSSVNVHSHQHHNNNCAPPKAMIKTGRKYYVFTSKINNHFIPVFSPELINKKNTKAMESVLCQGCGQAPNVGAPKEMVLKPKERLRVRCKLRMGNPVPTIKWYKDGHLVNFADSRYRLRAKRRQSIIVIRKASETDVGNYKCEVKNAFGTSSATTRVVLPRNKQFSSSSSTVTNKPIFISNSSSISSTSVDTTPTTLWPIKSSICPYDSYCLNGGTCSYYESISEYVCQCAEGYKGQRCDTKDINSGSMYLSYFCIFGTINPHYPCSQSWS